MREENESDETSVIEDDKGGNHAQEEGDAAPQQLNLTVFLVTTVFYSHYIQEVFESALEDLEDKMGTSIVKGLSSAQARELLKRDGKNAISTPTDKKR